MSLAVVLVGTPQSKTDPALSNFPLSAWEKQKEVTQIPWAFAVGKPSIRFDLRQEVTFTGWLRWLGGDKPPESDETHDFVLYARVLERGQPVGPVYSTPISLPPATLRAIARPGKYRVEIAVIDRATGRYNIQFENVTIDGADNPIERAFQSFGKFEFVPEPPRDPPEKDRARTVEEMREEMLEQMRRLRIGMGRGNLLIEPVVLEGSSLGFTADRPSFVVDNPGTAHISVITILNSPEEVVDQERLVDLFRNNQSNLFSVITRLEVTNGTAKLTGVDLEERTRVFNQIDLKELTSEMLERAMKKDARTVSLDALAGRVDQGTFFRDVLRERLMAAENDTSGARHTILVVGAHYNFPDNSGLKLPPVRDCHCQVFHVRFSLGPQNRADDIDDILKAYKPQIFEPLTWQEFREDFGKIYGQLLGRN